MYDCDVVELPVCSPLMQSVLTSLEQWEILLQGKLDLFAGPPQDYIPSCYPDQHTNGPAIFKYKTMMEPGSTPFL